MALAVFRPGWAVLPTTYVHNTLTVLEWIHIKVTAVLPPVGGGGVWCAAGGATA
jgi:hypothetical protein